MKGRQLITPEIMQSGQLRVLSMQHRAWSVQAVGGCLMGCQLELSPLIDSLPRPQPGAAEREC